jgi:LacI family transcriptional regulator
VPDAHDPAAARPVRTRRKSRASASAAPTIADVAALAGVSAMTVSRVLNGATRVSPSTARTVNAAVKRLRYRPNPAARALAGASPLRVCLLYANPSAAYLSELLVGLLAEAHAHHQQLVVERCDPQRVRSSDLRALVRSGVQGFIVPPPLCEHPGLLDALRRYAPSAVLIANGRPIVGFASVRINDEAAAYAMTQHLLALGHRRIGFIEGDRRMSAALERRQGYRRALQEAGVAIDRRWIRRGEFTSASGRAAAERLFALPERPTAIFASNDDMAAGVIAVAHRHGLSVPDDVTVVGFDDTPLAQTGCWPELTTVRQPIAEMAAAAVRLLTARLDGRPVADICLPSALIRRDSDAPPPALS